MNALLRSALAGAATGGRTFTGLAVLTATAPAEAQTQPDRSLRAPAAAVAVGLLAATELVLDKLPRTPSRLAPPGLLGRVAVAAGCGVIVTRRTWTRPERPQPPGEPIGSGEPGIDPTAVAAGAVTATAAAVATAWLGVWCRDRVSRRLGSAWVGAVLEDTAVIALAVAATR